MRVFKYGRLGLLILIILRILPTRWRSLLPYGRAGVKHRRKNRGHHVAKRVVSGVTTVESSTTNLPNSPNRPKKTVIPFLLVNLYFCLDPY
jgi:hypothetical protein